MEIKKPNTLSNQLLGELNVQDFKKFLVETYYIESIKYKHTGIEFFYPEKDREVFIYNDTTGLNDIYKKAFKGGRFFNHEEYIKRIELVKIDFTSRLIENTFKINIDTRNAFILAYKIYNEFASCDILMFCSEYIEEFEVELEDIILYDKASYYFTDKAPKSQVIYIRTGVNLIEIKTERNTVDKYHWKEQFEIVSKWLNVNQKDN